MQVQPGPCFRQPSNINQRLARRARDRVERVCATSGGDWRAFRASLIRSETREGNIVDREGRGLRLLRENEALMGISNPDLTQEELWAVPTTVIEKGSVLVAASASIEASTLLQQHQQEAVIFITRHDKSGTRGLILNRPTSLTLGRTLIRSSTGETSLRHLFEENVLYMGGANIQETVEVLHQRPDVWGVESEEVIPGIYWATGAVPEELDARLESAGCTVSDRSHQFKFFSGSETWRPGELELEVRDRLWTVASVSPAIVRKQCLQLPCPLWYGHWS